MIAGSTEKLCERIYPIFNAEIIFIDAPEVSSGSFVDFVKELCKGAFIEATGSI